MSARIFLGLLSNKSQKKTSLSFHHYLELTAPFKVPTLFFETLKYLSQMSRTICDCHLLTKRVVFKGYCLRHDDKNNYKLLILRNHAGVHSGAE